MRDLDKLSNHDMGYVFEHLIRRFAEDSNETAGEHFTPREVIKLMVNLLIAPDADTVAGEGQAINILDPACGTGGMLTAADDHIKSINPKAEVYEPSLGRCGSRRPRSPRCTTRRCPTSPSSSGRYRRTARRARQLLTQS